jgi:hypothetical protein
LTCVIESDIFNIDSITIVNESINRIHIQGGEYMKLNRRNFEIARARACMGQSDFEAAGVPKGTLCRAMGGHGIKPETLGKIARALNVDVTEIMEIEN